MNMLDFNERVAFLKMLLDGDKLSNRHKNRILQLSGLSMVVLSNLLKTPEGRKDAASKLIGKDIYAAALKKRRPKGKNQVVKLQRAMTYQNLRENNNSDESMTIICKSSAIAAETMKRSIGEGRKVHPQLDNKGIKEIADSLSRLFIKHSTR